MIKTAIPCISDLTVFAKYHNTIDFIAALGEPTWLVFTGADNTRARVIVTLLHGNEPSGTEAALALIREQFQPAVTTYILIASIETAMTEPAFSYRMLKGNHDLNRCFAEKLGQQNTSAHQLAERIVADIELINPELIIDVHNTSGEGPGFCVSPSASRYREQLEPLANLFTDTLILTDIHIGALMEHDFGAPIITVECGGNHSDESHQLAYEGFKQFMTLPDCQSMPKVTKFTTYRHPLRLEIKENYYLNYASEYQLGSDLTLRHDIEKLNFGTTLPEQNLGWLGPEGLKGLQALDIDGIDHVHDYFYVQDNQLHARNRLHLFMVTKNLEIAVSDCLFYFCEV